MQALEGLKGTVCAADDILIYGIGDDYIEAERNHDKKVAAMLSRRAEIGIKLNKDESEMKKREIAFLGHKVTNKGLEAALEKIEVITSMKTPNTIKETQRFIGMVNYLPRYLPQFS